MSATELSGALSADDIGYAGRVIGFGSNHRAWTATVLPSDGLGLELGLESTFVFRRNLEDSGNGQGVIPKIIPVPRFWLAYDLPGSIQLSTSIAPGWLFDGVTAIGFGGQWIFSRNEELRTNFSALATYTYVSAFDDIHVHVTGMSVQAARDLETWQPYIGAGVLIANATADNNRQGAGVDAGPHTLPALHGYIGVNLNFVGKFSIQLDLANQYLAAALLIAQKF